MNLRQLRYFVSVIDAGNMTRAAERLHVAQTALGMQIRQLEEGLCMSLLVRHSCGVEPTKSGALLYQRARAILTQVEETRQALAECERVDTETIRLGITPALMLGIGAELALAVREHLPQVFLSMLEAMSHVLVTVLRQGEADFVLCYDVPDLPGIARLALSQDELVLVSTPGVGESGTISFVDAIARPLAMPEKGDTVREAVTRVARELGLELSVAYEVRSVSAMKSLVGHGAAASILPLFSVMDEVRNGTLVARPIVRPPVMRTLFLASSSERAPFRNQQALTDAIQSAVQGLLDRLGPLGHPLTGY
jgi:LysR family nitrogen assimilation transcriptional regulator